MTSESLDTSGFTDQKARVRRFQEDLALSGPAFFSFKERMIIEWQDSRDALRDAIVSRGSVAVYGLPGGAGSLSQQAKL